MEHLIIVQDPDLFDLLGGALRVCEKIRSWFDRLTTSAMA